MLVAASVADDMPTHELRGPYYKEWGVSSFCSKLRE